MKQLKAIFSLKQRQQKVTKIVVIINIRHNLKKNKFLNKQSSKAVLDIDSTSIRS